MRVVTLVRLQMERVGCRAHVYTDPIGLLVRTVGDVGVVGCRRRRGLCRTRRGWSWSDRIGARAPSGRLGCSRWLRTRQMAAILTDPGSELCLWDDLHRNRHEAVAGAAQLRALAEIDAWSIYLR